jgi:protein involved in polysaccharide export with SLBB domain
MTLSQVLDLAGGITFSGWLERVQVERIEDHRRRIVVDFDLSDGFALQGPANPLATSVQDGDVITVFPVAGREQNVVSLQGHVIRPGKYEWRPGLRLRDIIPFSRTWTTARSSALSRRTCIRR